MRVPAVMPAPFIEVFPAAADWASTPASARQSCRIPHIMRVI
jgi:hypothetical protein